MRLVIKQKDGDKRELQFASGPINIGRAADSHVFLPDRTVSKKHCIIICEDDGNWIVQDMDSANKTLLNGEPIHSCQLKDGDSIQITDFTIEVSLSENQA